MKDPIERADAIDVVKRLMGDCELSRTVQTGLHILPSAQPDVPDINDGDMISRKAAIEKIEEIFPTGPNRSEYVEGIARGATEAKRYIEQLPSAQPEIIRCKDCKHKHVENMVWTCPFGLPGGENFFCGYGAEPYKGE